MPAGATPAWPAIVQKAHPFWRVAVNAAEKRKMADLVGEVDQALDAAGRVSVVVVFCGTENAAAEAYAQADAAAVGRQASQVLDRIKSHRNAAGAVIVLATPLPVIDARLDKWSVERFKGGQAASEAIAAALTETARAAGAKLLDFHGWVVSQKDESGKPGLLVGSVGWAMRDWGHPIAARWWDQQLTALDPRPADPAAFEAWKAAWEARRELARIIARTAGGEVRHGPALKSAIQKGKTLVEVPAELLAGPALDLVIASADRELGAVGHSGNLPSFRTVLSVSTDAGRIDIPLGPADWQLIDEAAPDKPVDPNLYRFNSGKANYFGVTSSVAGQRRLVLVRFELAALQGKKPQAATLSVPTPGGIERMVAPNQYEPVKGALGGVIAMPILPPDTDWDAAAATWKTRDGELGWTGGPVDSAARDAAIRRFLESGPPAEVADEARRFISGT